MTSVLEAIAKLPRFVKIRSIDENNAVVLHDNYERYKEYYRSYYYENRKKILEKKRAYNRRPEVKQHNAERHHNWYLEHKQEIRLQQKKYRNKKIEQNKIK